MHEVAAMRGAVTIALEQMRAASATRVTEVHMLLGASGHLTEAAARQHFAVFARGTPAEHATLTFTWLPATYKCLGCLRVFESTEPAVSVECPTCSAVALEIAHDETCAVQYVDVAYDEDADPAPGSHERKPTGVKDAAPSKPSEPMVTGFN
jgi:hydrogenase nickel insertion protein HypA